MEKQWELFLVQSQYIVLVSLISCYSKNGGTGLYLFNVAYS